MEIGLKDLTVNTCLFFIPFPSVPKREISRTSRRAMGIDPEPQVLVTEGELIKLVGY